jgi:pyruvate formate lyase activating enzyme
LYQKLDNKMVRCTACAWQCQIKPDGLGVCATRWNKDGELYSLVYGYAIGLQADPVEKKPLYHFLPGSRLLSFGTVGCNFGCEFCQNWEMSQINKRLATSDERQEKIQSIISEISVKISPKEIVVLAEKRGCRGIAYTYNEPAIFAEYAHDTMVLAKKQGLKNVYVSNGFENEETFDYLKEYLDAINIDLKSFRVEFYRDICHAKIEPVKENIRRFFEAGIETEVTTLVIPGLNDSDEELADIARFLVAISPDIPWHISAYFPAYKLDRPPTPAATLERAYQIGQQVGLKYVYVGNVLDEKRSQTRCFKCRKGLIKRLGYETQVVGIKKNACVDCGEKIYGVFA